jgi:hypothetical protein
MQQYGVEAWIAEDDLKHAAGRRVSLEDGLELVAYRAEHSHSIMA